MEVIKITEKRDFEGCDFLIRFPEERKHKPIKLLQLTDMQIIDSMQRRTPDRLIPDQINAWHPDLMDGNVFNHIKSLIAQTMPDIIFITGDMVYGSFDDAGTSFVRFCEFMDGFGIPWLTIFGNHDNETELGVDWQCDMLENLKHCIFRRGEVTGNGNYTVGISVGNELIRVIHMLDSHGCLRERGLYPDQFEMVRRNTDLICQKHGKNIPAFLCLHHPTDDFKEVAMAKGYETDERKSYVIGVDVEAKDGDFGSQQQKFKNIVTVPVKGFKELVKACHADAVFAGHLHSVNTCITYEGVKWVHGLKTGQYDYHTPGQLGGTLVTLDGGEVQIMHVPALVKYAPFDGGCCVFDDFFAEKTEIYK